jgi:hypothetical protein
MVSNRSIELAQHKEEEMTNSMDVSLPFLAQQSWLPTGHADLAVAMELRRAIPSHTARRRPAVVNSNPGRPLPPTQSSREARFGEGGAKLVWSSLRKRAAPRSGAPCSHSPRDFSGSLVIESLGSTLLSVLWLLGWRSSESGASASEE